jgi:hypothetical protein
MHTSIKEYKTAQNFIKLKMEYYGAEILKQ